jgi:hypothetical protein
MDIVCIRGDGLHPGDDLVEPLLSTVEAALSRGRCELDEGSLADEQRLETVLMDLRLGQIIQIDDTALGEWRGKLTALSHSVQIDDSGNLSGSSSFTFRKPR